MSTRNTNPAGNPLIRVGKPKNLGKPSPDLARKQDPRHSKGDFLSDLSRATDQVKRRLGDRP